jgi:hypothetical protein
MHNTKASSLLVLIFVLHALHWQQSTCDSPKHVHLSVSAVRSEMNVMWYTEEEADKSIVQYGTRSQEYTEEMEGSSQPIKYGSGYMHHATLIELLPSTVYYYRVGNGNGNDWSNEFKFHTQRAARGIQKYGSIVTLKDDLQVAFTNHQNSEERIKFVVYGDMGTWPRAEETINAVSQREVASGTLDMAIHVGDMAYAFGNFTKWNAWFSWVQSIAAYSPYMVCTGNRDEAEIIKERFYMPLDKTFSLYKPQEKQNFYYSYDYEFIHFVAISIKDNYTKSSDQYKWLENDLKKASSRLKDPKDELEWIFLYGHTPLYSSSNGHTGGNKELRAAIEQLLITYNVTLGFWGDDHGYERSYPVFEAVPDVSDYKIYEKQIQSFIQPSKPIHLLTGTSGIELDGWLPGDPPEWSAFREATHGYTKLEISRNLIMGKFIRTDGSIADQWAVAKRFAKSTSVVRQATQSTTFLLWCVPLVGAFILFGWRRKLFSLSTVNVASKIT